MGAETVAGLQPIVSVLFCLKKLNADATIKKFEDSGRVIFLEYQSTCWERLAVDDKIMSKLQLRDDSTERWQREMKIISCCHLPPEASVSVHLLGGSSGSSH